MKRIFFGHHKCASTWMKKIFYQIGFSTGLPVSYGNKPNKSLLIIPNATVETQSIYDDYLGIHVIRDPRDIVVSGYFSHLKTHDENFSTIKDLRSKLTTSTMEEGLFHEMDFLEFFFNSMYNWDYSNPKIKEEKFEVITKADYDYMPIFDFLNLKDNNKSVSNRAKLLLNKLHIRGLMPVRSESVSLDEKQIHDLWEHCSFKNITKGRKKGVEDTNSHFRKGTSGDWKNHFTDEHKEYFKKKFDDITVRLGYTTDNNW